MTSRIVASAKRKAIDEPSRSPSRAPGAARAPLEDYHAAAERSFERHASSVAAVAGLASGRTSYKELMRARRAEAAEAEAAAREVEDAEKRARRVAAAKERAMEARRGVAKDGDDTDDAEGDTDSSGEDADATDNEDKPVKRRRMLTRFELEVEQRNASLTAAQLDALLPGEADGFRIMAPPVVEGVDEEEVEEAAGGFKMDDKIDTAALKASLGISGANVHAVEGEEASDLPPMSLADKTVFGELLVADLEDSPRIAALRLIFLVKSGDQKQRKDATSELTRTLRAVGAHNVYAILLACLQKQNTMEEQERHLLIKLLDRTLVKAPSEETKPFVAPILAAMNPLLIDEDHFARAEATQAIGNLTKAVGLATILVALRVDVESADEYVRNSVSKSFAIVATVVGVPKALPFVVALSRSKKSEFARQTAMRIVAQIARLSGAGVLPHLRRLLAAVSPLLSDQSGHARRSAASAVAALATASAPYGIEAFDESVLEPLWGGVARPDARAKVLSSFLNAVGSVVPLMDPEVASHYGKRAVPYVLKQLSSSDEECKRIAVSVLGKIVAAEGVPSGFVAASVSTPFFETAWSARNSSNSRLWVEVVFTTAAISTKTGADVTLSKLATFLKADSASLRGMAADALRRVSSEVTSTADVSSTTEKLIVDAALFAFQEDVGEGCGGSCKGDPFREGITSLLLALGKERSVTSHVSALAEALKWRQDNAIPSVRSQAADAIKDIAELCEPELLNTLTSSLYEHLGEEYPDVLGSVLFALAACVACRDTDLEEMAPHVRDLLPTLTPILKNPTEKVRESVVLCVGLIAQKGPQHVAAREWMRICFELLELLRSPRRSIRRNTVETFGHIARAVGPQDVLHTLLNNLRVQERQLRVCTTVAVAVVAQACGPFTVLPSLMNEYRAPDANVQHGALKALSFTFEHLSEISTEYVYAVLPLLTSALCHRDPVHRQTAASAVKHLALSFKEDGQSTPAFVHLLNHIWPNIFEQNPHVLRSILEALEALRRALGSGLLLGYVVAGLFHPARFVRETYARVYNMLYVYGEHQMVPFQPMKNACRELDAFV